MNVTEIKKLVNELSNDDWFKLLSFSKHRLYIEVKVGKYGAIRTYMNDVTLDTGVVRLSTYIGDIDEMHEEHILEKWQSSTGYKSEAVR